MADEIGIPRRRHWRRQAERVGAAVGRAAFWGVPGLLQQSQSTGSNPRHMKRRRGTSYEFEMGVAPKRRIDRAYASKKYVKRCMSTMLEKKTIVLTGIIGNGGIPTSTGRVDPLGSFNIIQGTGDGNRTGNFIEIKKVVIRFNGSIPVGTPNSNFRVIIFTDKQVNGATPAITDVIETGTGGMMAGYNDDLVIQVGGPRFKILMDKLYTVNCGAGAADASSTTTAYTFTKVLNGPFKVHYDTTTGAIADIVSGEIFIATVANGTNAVVACSAQITFVDA